MLSARDLERASEAFSLAPNFSEALGPNRWRFQTEHGPFLVTAEESLDSLRSQFALAEYAASRGFRRMPRFRRTIFDDPWFTVGGIHVYATREPGGRELSSMQEEDVKVAAELLADYHTVMADYDASESNAPIQHGGWVHVFQNAAASARRWLESNRLQASGEEWFQPFLKTGSSTLERMEQMSEALVRTGYEDYARQSQPLVCHGNFQLGTLRRLESGRTMISTLGSGVVDVPLYDLARLCHDLYRPEAHHLVHTALEAYGRKRPLSSQEQRLVLAYVFFPHRELRAMRETMRATGSSRAELTARYQDLVAHRQDAEPRFLEDPRTRSIWS